MHAANAFTSRPLPCHPSTSRPLIQRALLHSLGCDSSPVQTPFPSTNTHSLRIVAAMAVAWAGLHPSTIQLGLHGCSSAFTTYTHQQHPPTPPTDTATIASARCPTSHACACLSRMHYYLEPSPFKAIHLGSSLGWHTSGFYTINMLPLVPRSAQWEDQSLSDHIVG